MPYVVEEIDGHVPEAESVFTPRGAVKQLWTSRDRETMVSGPAETGKTWGCVQYLDALLWRYPKAQAVMCRKTYASLVGSALRTYKRVLGDNSPVRAYGGERPEWFDYPNNSRLWIVGLDNPQKALSSERDLIYVNQAEELTLEDWETLTTRCTGRGSVMPYTRMFGDCNPGPPSHWILHRQGLKMLESRHEDNPTLFGDAGEDGQLTITTQGEITLSVLDALTGARKGRLRYGRWMQAEGAVYDEWDAARHLVDRTDPRYGLQNGVPATWPRLWTVDFGFTNPFVWQCWAIDPDGRMLRIREIYKTQTLVEDHAVRIRQLSEGEPPPVAVVCDHDAEGRATLERYLGVQTIPAYKGVADGIQAVAGRLKTAKDGSPRLLYLRDSLDEVDDALLAARRPTCTEEEYDVYVWETGGGVKAREQPHKDNDHGMDASRYSVVYLDDISAGAGGGLMVSNYAFGAARRDKASVARAAHIARRKR